MKKMLGVDERGTVGPDGAGVSAEVEREKFSVVASKAGGVKVVVVANDVTIEAGTKELRAAAKARGRSVTGVEAEWRPTRRPSSPSDRPRERPARFLT